MESHWKDPQQRTIQFKKWAVDNPTFQVVMIHGLGEHLHRYEHVAAFYNSKGAVFRGPDLPGHGKSAGKRGHVSSIQEYHATIQQAIQQAKEEYPSIPLILMGHSLGGMLVLSYLVDHQPEVTAVVATSPGLELAEDPNPLIVAFAKLMDKIYPSMLIPNQLKFENLSRVEAVRTAYDNDPLVHKTVSVRGALVGLAEGKRLRELQETVHTPILIVHGTADEITGIRGSRTFVKNMRGPIAFKEWEGYYHETHNDLDNEQVLEYNYQWIQQQF